MMPWPMRRDLRTRLAVLSILLLLATVLVPAQSSPPGLISNLESYLESLRVQAGIPGMSAAVVQDGEIVWEFGFGYQNVAARIRATPRTPYQIGDLSETFAAVLLLQCVEQRRLDLDERVTRYGLSFPEADVTLRQVLTHTSTGVPGTSFQFAPDRFAQLAGAVEYCAPQPYRKSVAHRLFNGLAMQDSVPGTDLQDPNVVPEDLFEKSDLERYRDVLARLAVPYKVDGRGRSERMELPPAG